MGERAGSQDGRQDLFRLLVESVRDYAIFLLDPEGYVRSWNEGAARIKGYRAEEIIGRHFSTFYPVAEVRRGKPEYGLRVATDEGRWEEEGWRIRRDGSRFWASVVITALRDSAGELVGFAKVTRDLSERRRAEEERLALLERERAARAETEQRLDQLSAIQAMAEAALAHVTLDSVLPVLLERIADAMAVDTVVVLLPDAAGEDGLVVRAALGLEGTAALEARGQAGGDFAGRVAAERRPILLEEVVAADPPEPYLDAEAARALLGVPVLLADRLIGVLHVGARRRRHFLPADVQFLQVAADRVALAIDHARLMDAARVARVEAEVAERMLRAQDEFLSVAAHELKTPLTSAHLACQALLPHLDRLPPGWGDARRLLDLITGEVDRLGRLVTQLLESVRLEAGRFALNEEEVDLATLAHTVAARMRPRAGGAEVRVTAEGPIVVRGDSLRLEEVLANLLDNAIRFSPEGGCVDVAVERPEGRAVRLWVRDRGPGVTPALRVRLFERYFQGHTGTHQSGLGLGLYISRRIVAEHGGELAAEFPADGGTRMVVTLPVEAGEPAWRGLG